MASKKNVQLDFFKGRDSTKLGLRHTDGRNPANQLRYVVYHFIPLFTDFIDRRWLGMGCTPSTVSRHN